MFFFSVSNLCDIVLFDINLRKKEIFLIYFLIVCVVIDYLIKGSFGMSIRANHFGIKCRIILSCVWLEVLISLEIIYSTINLYNNNMICKLIYMTG